MLIYILKAIIATSSLSLINVGVSCDNANAKGFPVPIRYGDAMSCFRTLGSSHLQTSQAWFEQSPAASLGSPEGNSLESRTGTRDQDSHLEMDEREFWSGPSPREPVPYWLGWAPCSLGIWNPNSSGSSMAPWPLPPAWQLLVDLLGHLQHVRHRQCCLRKDPMKTDGVFRYGGPQCWWSSVSFACQ